jgi:dihydrofolate reductase
MIQAIFSSDFWGGMGLDGTIPWTQTKEEIDLFDKLTKNQVLVMGRRSWDDNRIPKPYLNRIVYVVSNRQVHAAGRISGDIKEQLLSLERQHQDRTISLIGGPKLLMDCADVLDLVYLTHRKDQCKVDTKIDLKLFLRGFNPVMASVSGDLKSTLVKYEPLFKRNPSTSSKLQSTD